MIGVAATFDSEEAGNSLLEVLAKREVSPDRIGVTVSGDGGVDVIVQTDEADYQEMAELMREHGASAVEVDMTGGREPSSPGRPTLTDPAPPPYGESG